MNWIVGLILIILSLSSYADDMMDTVYFIPTNDTPIIGEQEIQVEVIISVPTHNIDNCDSIKGFHLGQREDNNNLIIYCGFGKIGTKYKLIIEKGI